MTIENSDFFGKRDLSSNIKRIVALLALFCVVVVMELSVGQQFEKKQKQEITTQNENWARKYFYGPEGSVAIPKKTNGLKRILYISNSHAFTGGKVSNHLQELLDHLDPDKFEVLDMSDPGIFAPDMLQRTLLGLDFEPDAIIMAVAYISFSDRMKLSLQAHSARSFFKRGIFSKLSPDFWLRNYDIGIYADTFIAQHLSLYRYRNAIRDQWEQPLTRFFHSFTKNKTVLFLEVDENQQWKFPEGYDNNLFEWRLYTVGRVNHLRDLSEALMNTRRANVPVLAFNLPIHWEKSLYPYNVDDVDEYRHALTEIFQGVSEYVDYQDTFPKEFTTYDALHPTWYGARLHALDIALRMKKQGYFTESINAEKIVDVYLKVGAAISTDYRAALNGDYPSYESFTFPRYDITEPKNARDLMRRLSTVNIGSIQERDLLYKISLRIRYWTDTDFGENKQLGHSQTEIFQRAVREEIKRAKKRIAYFKSKLTTFQKRRLESYPLPSLKYATPIQQHIQHISQNNILHVTDYRLPDGSVATQVTNVTGQPVAYGVTNKDRRLAYRRVDLLGDGSFLLLQIYDGPMLVPTWVVHGKPYVKFGI